MTTRFLNLLFSPAVKSAQRRNGSHDVYAARSGVTAEPDRLTAREAQFIAARDSFYMASVGADGWPYVQHRGGPAGFVKILGERSLGFADFRGNRQYVTLGNVSEDDRVALFFMDYPRRTRLKLLGHVRTIALDHDPELAVALIDAGYGARVERGFRIEVEAFDWNCPQHITPRFTADEIATAVKPLRDKIADLEAEVARLSSGAQSSTAESSAAPT